MEKKSFNLIKYLIHTNCENFKNYCKKTAIILTLVLAINLGSLENVNAQKTNGNKKINNKEIVFWLIENWNICPFVQEIIKIQWNKETPEKKYEALMRLKSSDWKTLSPRSFFPILMQNPEYYKKASYQLIEKCLKIAGKLWKKIAFNFTEVEFLDKDFYNLIKNYISSWKIDPKLVTIEFVETIPTEIFNNKLFIQSIENFNLLWVNFAIDDFNPNLSWWWNNNENMKLISKYANTIKIDKNYTDYILTWIKN